MDDSVKAQNNLKTKERSSPCDPNDPLLEPKATVTVRDTLEYDLVKQMLTTDVADELDLALINVSSDWIVLQRRKFDLTLLDEPHHAIQLLLQPKTGSFIERIWGRTFLKGNVAKIDDLRSLCWEVFHRTVPCLGFYDIPDVPYFHTDDFDIVAYPVKRQISKNCRQIYKLPDDEPAVTELLGIGLCQECLNQPKIEEGTGRAYVKKEEVDVDDPEYDPDRDFFDSQYSHQDSKDLSDFSEASSSSVSSSSEDEDGFKKEKKPKRTKSAKRKGKRERSKPKIVKDGDKSIKFRNDYSDLVVKSEGRVYYQCPKCTERKFLSPRALNYHRSRQHHFGPFICQFCDSVVEYADDLYSHFSTSHSESVLNCPCCTTQTFTTCVEEDFLRHYRLCFRKKARIERQAGTTKKQVKKKIFPCQICQKRFVSKCNLNEHLNWHKGLKPLKCTECDFATSFATSMYTHNKIHMREKGMERTENDIPLIFYCDACGKGFNSANYLKEHKRKVHEGRKDERVCEECGMVFTNRTNLRRHKARSHPKDASRKCEICGYQAADNTGFLMHQRVHKEGEFICRFCAKAVKSKQTLMAHERSHTGETPFKCKTCGYACKSSSVLRRHIVLQHERPEKRQQQQQQQHPEAQSQSHLQVSSTSSSSSVLIPIPSETMPLSHTTTLPN